MLKVQEYLNKFNNPTEAIQSLKDEFAIEVVYHPTDSLIILNYNMIESPKLNEIVRECRGLVLDMADNFAIIAKGFQRFFNHCETEHLEFDWSDVTGSHKEDGSFILHYNYKDSWRVNTKGSFGFGEINDSGYTWCKLFEQCLFQVKSTDFRKEYTYVFELCSMYNQVVRYYQYPQIFLLAVFDKFGNEINVDGPEFQYFEKPTTIKIHSIDEAIAYIKKQEKDDKTFEGLVLKDKHGNRMKVKSESYLILHRSANNGYVGWEQIYTSCLTDDGGEEFLSYFPSYRDRFDTMRKFIADSKTEIVETYEKYKGLESQKDFALSVKDSPFSFALFSLRKNECDTDKLFVNKTTQFLRVFDRKKDVL